MSSLARPPSPSTSCAACCITTRQAGPLQQRCGAASDLRMPERHKRPPPTCIFAGPRTPLVCFPSGPVLTWRARHCVVRRAEAQGSLGLSAGPARPFFIWLLYFMSSASLLGHHRHASIETHLLNRHLQICKTWCPPPAPPPPSPPDLTTTTITTGTPVVRVTVYAGSD